MKPMGGSEILYNNFCNYVGPYWPNNLNLIMSTCEHSQIQPHKINVLWQHLSYDQKNVQLLHSQNFLDSLQHIVFVSNWQYDAFKSIFNIHNKNNHVIKNAIVRLPFIEKPKEKLKIIYTSMPNRGLSVLLDSFDIMNRNDVELVIYSSNIIYGKEYFKGVNDEKLFHRCKTNKNITYRGYSLNSAIRKELQKSHIFAYPSIFQETSCLSAIEAGAAGCRIVTTNYGALPETCDRFAEYVEYDSDYSKLSYNFAEKLNRVVDNYWKECYDLEKQSNWFNENYCWQNKKMEWIKLIGKICEK
jgi:glycosyltransferase involved in cell wall biosynthesis